MLQRQRDKLGPPDLLADNYAHMVNAELVERHAAQLMHLRRQCRGATWLAPVAAL